jgi:hypothetical protein
MWFRNSDICVADTHRNDSEDRNGNSEHDKRSKKSCENITRVKIIQNMVLGSIKSECISLFTIILVMLNFKYFTPNHILTSYVTFIS